MKASKIELSGEYRIKLEFPYNYYAASLLKQIPGAKWSMSLKAWHIPYTKAAFAQLKKLFPLVDYPQKSTGEISSEPVVKTAVPEFHNQDHQNKNVSVQVTGRMIILKLPKNALDTHFITSFRYSRWDGKQYCWIVPNYPGNLDLIHDYFNERIYELIVYEDFEVKISADTQRKIKTNQLIIIKAVTGRLKLIFGFNNELN
jgi:hypothetical protein